MSRRKAYTPAVICRQLESARRGIIALSRYKTMLAEQQALMGTDEFIIWMDKHGFMENLTNSLIDLNGDTKNVK